MKSNRIIASWRVDLLTAGVGFPFLEAPSACHSVTGWLHLSPLSERSRANLDGCDARQKMAALRRLDLAAKFSCNLDASSAWTRLYVLSRRGLPAKHEINSCFFFFSFSFVKQVQPRVCPFQGRGRPVLLAVPRAFLSCVKTVYRWK